ncbi:MAG: DinB family protein [Chloroflexota bacterium]
MTASAEENPGEAQARRLERVNEQLATLMRQPDVARRLRAAPGENEWSAMQTVGHLAEMIPYWLGHCQALIAATAEPPHFGRSLDAPDRLTGVERGAMGSPDELLRLLNGEIQAAAQAIRQFSAVERGMKGIHPRLGEVTVADVVEILIVAHAEDHLAQARAALRA